MASWHCRGCGNITYEKDGTNPSNACQICGKRSWANFRNGTRIYKCRTCGNTVEWDRNSFPPVKCTGCGRNNNWKAL